MAADPERNKAWRYAESDELGGLGFAGRAGLFVLLICASIYLLHFAGIF